MANKNKAIQDQIDALIKEIKDNPDLSPDEVDEAINQIQNDLDAERIQKEDGDKQALQIKLDTLQTQIADTKLDNGDLLERIIEALRELEIPPPQVTVQPPEVVVNVPEIKVPETKIPEIKMPKTEIKYPESMSIKKPAWLPSFSLKPVTDAINKLIQAIPQVKWPTAAKDAIAVRLSDGEKFYRSIGAAASSISDILTFKTSDGEKAAALVDADGKLVTTTTVEVGDIEIGAVEIKDATTDTRAVVGADGLYTEVRASALPTGASTAAKQDTGNTSLGNIDTNAGATSDAATTAGSTGSISAKLRLMTTQLSNIDGNTNGIETLLLAIASYVDDLEALLGTSNTNTGATATSVASIDTKTPALGQALAAASTPVVLPAAQITTLTPPAAITGYATSAKQDTLLTELQLKADLTDTQPVLDTNSAAIKTALEIIDNFISGSRGLVTEDNSAAIAASASVLDDWDESDRAKVNPIVGQAGIDGNAGTITAKTVRTQKGTGSTSTQTQVADSASSVTILAANTGRIRCTVTNDSTEILYLRENSSAATTSNYTHKIQPDGVVHIDDYNGALTGIWAANASGAAVVSEVTA